MRACRRPGSRHRTGIAVPAARSGRPIGPGRATNPLSSAAGGSKHAYEYQRRAPGAGEPFMVGAVAGRRIETTGKVGSRR